MKAIFEIQMLLLCLLAAWGCCGVSSLQPKLIVILVDGVRWDYTRDLKGGLRQMAREGVRAEYVVPSFPSLSYVNYQTIATGLHPESHGFVGNHMYDPDEDAQFHMIPTPNSTAPFWWAQAEPIWVTAERAGRHAAVYWWAGCEVRIHDTHPTICERQSLFRYGPRTDDDKEDFEERFEDILALFKPSKSYPASRLDLAMLYYGSVDYAGHHFGPGSSEVKKAMKDVDDIVAKLISKIKKSGLQVNVMVVSDHGMTETGRGAKRISLEAHSSLIKHQMDYGASSMIFTSQPDTLAGLLSSVPGLTAWRRTDIPDKYHLKNNNRTGTIMLKADKGYVIDLLSRYGKSGGNVGDHGYDPEEVNDMRTIFFGWGHGFRSGYTSTPLYTTDLYNIMCRLLGVEGHPNNGSWARVNPLFSSSAQVPPSPRGVSAGGQIAMAGGSALLVCGLALLIKSRYHSI